MKFSLKDKELDFSPIRASGPGGQHVNKVSSAVQLRFDIAKSSLPAWVRSRLLELSDRRISSDGIVIIKAQRFRSQEKNKQDAVDRLELLLDKAATQEKPRIPSRPGRGAKERRLREKKQQGDKKALRKPGSFD
jgi:ribosome-associated protein